jgi:hypothetical protein
MRLVSATGRLIGGGVFLLAIGWASQAYAQLGVGNWARTDDKGMGMTMTVEACCNGGRRLIYHMPAMDGQPAMMLTVDSPMDGTEAPAMVGGKPSGETMAIKRIDDRHYSSVVKMGGRPFGTSNATLSADGRTLTIEWVTQSPAGKLEKAIETWVKK